MNIDKELTYFMDKDLSSQGTGNLDSPVIDHGIPAPNSVGKGDPLVLDIQVTEDIGSGGAATVGFKLQHSDDGETFEDTSLVIAPVALASLKAGLEYRHSFPENTKQYTRVRVTVAAAALNAGTIAAYATAS